MMAVFLTPPPSVEDFLNSVVRWVAHNLRCKITVKIDYTNGDHETRECDFRIQRKKVGADDTATETPNAIIQGPNECQLCQTAWKEITPRALKGE